MIKISGHNTPKQANSIFHRYVLAICVNTENGFQLFEITYYFKHYSIEHQIKLLEFIAFILKTCFSVGILVATISVRIENIVCFI